MTKIFLLVLLAVSVAGCDSTTVNTPPDLGRLSFPISVATHPEGRYLYIASAGFDRKASLGTISVFDSETHRFLPNAAVTTELFAGELKIVEKGDEYYAITTSRDQNALYQFRIDASKGDAEGHLSLAFTKDSFGVRPFADDPYSIEVDAEGITVGHLTNGVVSRWGFRENGELEFGCSITMSGSSAQIAKHPSLDRGGT